MLIVVLVFWLVPQAWIRWLLGGRPPVEPVPVQVDPLADERGLLRLIPPPSVVSEHSPRREPVGEVVTPRRRPAPSEAEDASPAPDGEQGWTWDPTTPYRIAEDLFGRSVAGIGEADRLVRHLELRRRLSVIHPSFFVSADTSQYAQATQRWRAVDEWVNRVLGPAWAAQGAAARLGDLYERAVLEAEREGQ